MSPSPMINDSGDDIMFEKRGCCFWITGTDSKTTSPSSNDLQWCARGWAKVREWSEMVAGPKWKTFIRRFNKNYYQHRTFGYSKQGSFQYDPLSYALNFDDGTGDKEDEYYSHDFSSRYASVPASAKSSMDLGKDSPSFV
ncbi:hypothetical protein VNO77_20096 [Canavalia gladiata]|uniref:Uncharacterized protein n=1 Tax=Canavalia gladiata TaxID=3824 RepID=A0AAN9LPJ8_CANGL